MRNRSVIEIIVFVFLAIVAFMMFAGIIFVAVVEIRDSTADTQPIVQTLTNLTSAILGALLGLLAGKRASTSGLSMRPDGALNGIEEID